MRSSYLAVVGTLTIVAACGDSRPTPLDCLQGQLDCDGRDDIDHEANLRSAVTCGGSGLTCGGDAPLARPERDAFQPVVVAGVEDELDLPAALAVNATSIFWTERTRVRSCPLPAGCTLEPTLIAEMHTNLNDIAVTENAVYFTGCRGVTCDDSHYLLQCSVSGCPEPAPRMRSTSLTFDGIILGKTRAYWLDASERLFGCALADCAATSTRWPFSLFGEELAAVTTDGDTIYVKTFGSADLRTCVEAEGCSQPKVLPDSASIRAPFRVHAGMAYWLDVSPRGPEVRKCELATNCGRGTRLAVDDGSTELEVDDTGVYWLNPTKGTLRHCPLAGCSRGRPTVLTRGRASPKELLLGNGFVYWIEGNTIVKLAKPKA